MHLEMSSGLRRAIMPQLDDGGHCHGVLETVSINSFEEPDTSTAVQ